MLWTIFVILLVLWLLGVVTSYTLGGFIHVLLVVAVILAIMGNTVVAVPFSRGALVATDLYQVLDTSDVPGGVLNIVTGIRDELAPVLAAHDDVDGLWYFGSADGSAEVERLSSGNMVVAARSYGRLRMME